MNSLNSGVSVKHLITHFISNCSFICLRDIGDVIFVGLDDITYFFALSFIRVLFFHSIKMPNVCFSLLWKPFENFISAPQKTYF